MTKIMTSPSPKAKLATGGQPSPVGEGVKFPPLWFDQLTIKEGRTKEGSFDSAQDKLLRMIKELTPPLRGEEEKDRPRQARTLQKIEQNISWLGIRTSRIFNI